eukprot:1991789-Amphidinium_carterae.1
MAPVFMTETRPESSCLCILYPLQGTVMQLHTSVRSGMYKELQDCTTSQPQLRRQKDSAAYRQLVRQTANTTKSLSTFLQEVANQQNCSVRNSLYRVYTKLAPRRHPSAEGSRCAIASCQQPQ